MAKGKVDFFKESGGYGFIATDDYEDDVFFHMEDVGGPDLEEDQEVEFDIAETDDGPRAENLERL
ncbi:cold-shock protein [Haloarchaeobius sp. DFWS5]|uniref:cold-shock protein n=1 Tax=Haloarchaeobius sp. DFWS5 TaxID=3446114 RepID=UPI003EBAF860